ncbi:MAG: sugar phosphate isomerase/epimerase [Eubacteriales bacterium]|nr:sugar phosphate isomerase/epimerase [Eubacteriales bacterium]
MSTIKFEQFSVMSVQYVQHSLAYYLDSMVRCGIRNVDFWGGVPHYNRMSYSTAAEAEKRLKQIRRNIDDRGLHVVVYTPETLSYPFSYASPEKAVRNSTIRYMEAAMEDAEILGTNQVFLNTGCGLRDLPREESWKRCVESIRTLCEKAESRGIEMIIEQLQPYESNLLVSREDMTRMLREVDSPALNVCVDVVAMEVMGETLRDQYDRFRDHIRLIHYCDGDPSGHSILGTGNLPLKEYIDILEENDFTGYLSLEINDSIYWMDPHDSIQKSVDYIHNELGL